MLKIFFLSLLLTALSFAQDNNNYSFVGISTSIQNIDTKFKDASWENTLSLKYGQQSLDWRTIFALNYTQDSYFSGHIEIDKILLDNMFGTAKIRPYFGAVIGYMAYDDSNLNITIKESDSVYYGGKLGFIIYMSDDIDIDLSYHYYLVPDFEFLDNLHGATLSVHYFF